MSRRRKSVPFPKRTKDMEMRRLRYVCTNRGRHDIETQDVFQRHEKPGRPDLQAVNRSWASTGIGPCPKCGKTWPQPTDEQVTAALNLAGRSETIRWDISTNRLVT
jgi:hypothetical protein